MKRFYADPAQHRRLMTVVERAPRPRAARRAPRRRRSTSPTAATASIDLGHRRARAGGAARRSRQPLQRARRRPRPHRRRRARHRRRRPGSAPSAIDALYFTGGSTGLATARRTAAAALSARPRGARRPLRERRDRARRCTRAPVRALALQERRSVGSAPRPSPAPVASTLPRFRPATQIRPERTR